MVYRNPGQFSATAGLFAVGASIGATTSVVVVVLLLDVLKGLAGAGMATYFGVGLLVAAAARDLGARVPLPYRSQQVPEWWRQALPPGPVAFLFGAVLGTGFVTHFTSSAHLAFLVILWHLSSLDLMLALAVTFAMAKTLVLLAGRGASDMDELAGRFTVHHLRDRVLHVAAAAVTGGTIYILIS